MILHYLRSPACLLILRLFTYLHAPLHYRHHLHTATWITTALRYLRLPARSRSRILRRYPVTGLRSFGSVLPPLRSTDCTTDRTCSSGFYTRTRSSTAPPGLHTFDGYTAYHLDLHLVAAACAVLHLQFFAHCVTVGYRYLPLGTGVPLPLHRAFVPITTTYRDSAAITFYYHVLQFCTDSATGSPTALLPHSCTTPACCVWLPRYVDTIPFTVLISFSSYLGPPHLRWITVTALFRITFWSVTGYCWLRLFLHVTTHHTGSTAALHCLTIYLHLPFTHFATAILHTCYRFGITIYCAVMG